MFDFKKINKFKPVDKKQTTASINPSPKFGGFMNRVKNRIEQRDNGVPPKSNRFQPFLDSQQPQQAPEQQEIPVEQPQQVPQNNRFVGLRNSLGMAQQVQRIKPAIMPVNDQIKSTPQQAVQQVAQQAPAQPNQQQAQLEEKQKAMEAQLNEIKKNQDPAKKIAGLARRVGGRLI